MFNVHTLQAADTSVPKRQSCAASIVKKLGVALVAVALGAPFVAEGVGNLHGTPHAGMGIYFDWENVQGKLSTELREEMESETRDDLRFVRMLAEELSPGYNVAGEAVPFISPRMASEYINRYDGPPNTCRHKSIIMAKILRTNGINCVVRWGRADVNADEGALAKGEKAPIHVWVELTDFGYIADPTQGILMNHEDYHIKYVRQEFAGDFEVVAKSIGLIGR